VAVLEPVIAPTARVLLRGLLIPFAVLAGYFVAWGTVFCMDAIVRAFFGTISGAVAWIPYAGSVITAPLHGVEKKLTSFLGGLEAHFENQMASRWHQLAQLVSQWARDAEAIAVFEWQIARKLGGLYALAASGQLAARWRSWVTGELERLAHTAAGAIGKTTIIEKTIVVKGKAGAVTIVRPIVAGLSHVIDIDLPGLRARDRVLQDEITRLWKWARGRGAVIGEGIGLGALAYALGKLGIGWARCSNVNKLGKRACGLSPTLLESLLAGSLAIAGSISIVELAKECQRFESTAEDGLKFFVRELS
jgi:hypothetical protein